MRVLTPSDHLLPDSVLYSAPELDTGPDEAGLHGFHYRGHPEHVVWLHRRRADS